MTAAELAAAAIQQLRSGPEWSPDNLVNLHEVADILEEVLPPLVESFAPFPIGWNPTAQAVLRSVLIDLISAMERADREVPA